MKKTAITLVLMVIALGALCTFAQAAPQICLGTITYNGNPVEGATVKCYYDSWCYITSTFPSLASGAYEWRGYQAAGYYRLSVDCPTGWARVRFYYGGFPGDPTGVNISLSSGTPTAIPACKD